MCLPLHHDSLLAHEAEVDENTADTRVRHFSPILVDDSLCEYYTRLFLEKAEISSCDDWELTTVIIWLPVRRGQDALPTLRDFAVNSISHYRICRPSDVAFPDRASCGLPRRKCA